MDSEKNMTDFAGLGCHLCNVAGTESCDESYGACLCKPWYEGTYCENCRFFRDYVMAPNGSCIPCNCGLRSIYECLQRDLCMKYAGDSVREAIAVSALFLSAIATITCLSLCIVWRIISKNKRSRPAGDDALDGEDLESGLSAGGARVDLVTQLSPTEDEDYDDSQNDRRRLLPSNSDQFDVTSLSHSLSTAVLRAQQAESDYDLATKCADSKRATAVEVFSPVYKCNENIVQKNDNVKLCTKHYFSNVRRDVMGDEV